ncbi:hypothetical protein CRYUN_Cryun19dG0106900 [Craigia yunnanensis]
MGVADVCVAMERDIALGERVEMSVRKRKKNRMVGFDRIKEIPEEREWDSGCCCNCRESGHRGLKGRCDEDCGGRQEMDRDAKGVSWAFDVGIWM